jgi:hypothetical protein
LPTDISRAADAVLDLALNGLPHAQNAFNS